MSGNSFDDSNALALVLLNNFVGAFDFDQTYANPVFTYTEGATFPEVTAGYGEVILNSSLTAPLLLPASFPVLYDATTTATTIYGAGGDNQAVVAGSGGLTYDFNGGDGVIYTGNTPVDGVAPTGDLIFLNGPGAGYVAAGEGQDTIVASAGANYIAVGAGLNQVFLEGGTNIVASEGNDQIAEGTGSLEALGHDTVSIGGNATLYGGSGSLLVLNGSGASELTPQADPVTGAVLNTGSDTVFGGLGGGMYFAGTGGNSIMVSGDQATTLFGGGNNDVMYAYGSGNDQLVADGPNSFLIGTAGTGNNTYFAHGNNTYIAGGGGSDTYVAGPGNSTMTASAGADTFIFTNGDGGGYDVIYGFKNGLDQISLCSYDSNGYSAAVNAAAQAKANSAGGSTYVTLSDNTTIYFLDTPHLASNAFAG